MMDLLTAIWYLKKPYQRWCCERIDFSYFLTHESWSVASKAVKRMIDGGIYSPRYLPEVLLLLLSPQPIVRNPAQAWLLGMVKRLMYLEP